MADLHDSTTILSTTLLQTIVDKFKNECKPTQADWYDLIELGYHYITFNKSKYELYTKCRNAFKTNTVVTASMLQDLVNMFKQSMTPKIDIRNFPNFATGKIPTGEDFAKLINMLAYIDSNLQPMTFFVECDVPNTGAISNVNVTVATFNNGNQFNSWAGFTMSQTTAQRQIYLPTKADITLEVEITITLNRNFDRYNYAWDCFYTDFNSDGSENIYTYGDNPIIADAAISYNRTNRQIVFDMQPLSYDGFDLTNLQKGLCCILKRI